MEAHRRKETLYQAEVKSDRGFGVTEARPYSRFVGAASLVSFPAAGAPNKLAPVAPGVTPVVVVGLVAPNSDGAAGAVVVAAAGVSAR